VTQFSESSTCAFDLKASDLEKSLSILVFEKPYRVWGATNEKTVESDWLFSVLSEGQDAQPTVSQLSRYVIGVNSLISSGSYHVLNKALVNVRENSSTISSRTLITLARAAVPVNHKLAGWMEFVLSIAKCINDRGSDSKSLLRGII
jgi:hypothetical protein